MPTDFKPTQHGPRKLRIATLLRPGVRHAVAGRAADRRLPRPRDRGPHQRVLQPADRGDRPLHAGAAEQLEALRRERQGHLPREPAAPVLHHLPHHPADAGRRRAGRAPTAATMRATRIDSRRRTGHRLSRPAASGNETTTGWPTRACSTRSTSSTTTSSCRSCRSSPASCCSRSTTASPCARSCRRGVDAHGPQLDLFRLRRRHAGADARARLKQRTWSGRPASSRWRTAASAASCSAASPRPARRMSVVEMGGSDAESQETRATEASVRGFWKAYRHAHGPLRAATRRLSPPASR